MSNLKVAEGSRTQLFVVGMQVMFITVRDRVDSHPSSGDAGAVGTVRDRASSHPMDFVGRRWRRDVRDGLAVDGLDT